MKNTINKALFIIWAFSVYILPSLSLLAFFISAIKVLDLTTNITGTVPGINSQLILLILIPGIGAALSIGIAKYSPILFWKLSKRKILVYINISLILSYLIWKYSVILSSMGLMSFLFLFLFFMAYLPNVNSFINMYDIGSFKDFFEPAVGSSNKIKFKIKRLIIIFLSFVLIYSVSMIVDKAVNRLNDSRLFIARSPQIKKISPEIVYHGNKMIIYGKGFGWKGAVNSRFLNQYKEITPELWTDSKVILSVPLDWKIGKIRIWIEKPMLWQGKTVISKSRQINIKLIDRLGPFDKDDDHYYQQLEKLDKEVLYINGYK